LEQVTDLVGVGGADVGEQGEGLLPAGQGSLGSAGVAQGVAQDDQGAGLAQGMAGLAVDGQRLVGVLDGLGVVALGEVGCGQGGVGLLRGGNASEPTEHAGDIPAPGGRVVAWSELHPCEASPQAYRARMSVNIGGIGKILDSNLAETTCGR
jgi:hypothetical protein